MAKFYKGVWSNPATDYANDPDSVEPDDLLALSKLK